MHLVVNELEKLGIEYRCNFSMSKFTSLRVGGFADFVIYPSNILELTGLVKFLNSIEYPWIVLGAGTNTIVMDKGISKAVIITKKMRNIDINKDGLVISEAGANLGTILLNTVRSGFTGFEFAAGIPGTVGGGVFMNAGANGAEIKDILSKVWILIDDKVEEIDRNDIKFEYRKSNLPEDSVVIKASFNLESGNRDFSEKVVKEYLEKRSQSQPITISNTGSIFKNPLSIPAGKLIEELGLKGRQHGGAQISELHGNFIVNVGSAKASDVLSLINLAKRNALEMRGIRLETEVRIFG
jgi:UDP-N-acetylmuramate dehydrogenase